jgi:S-layer protein
MSAATKAVNYTGGTGADAVTINNGQNNIASLGDGNNTFTGGAGSNTITAGTGSDTVTASTGNNIVNLGDGLNIFTATLGKNTYTGGTGVDTVTLGTDTTVLGVNNVTGGAGADIITFKGFALNGNSYSYVNDAAVGDTISFAAVGSAGTFTAASTFTTAQITLAPTAAFADYLNAAASTATSSSTGNFAWFQYGGNTYIVEDMNSAAGTFQNGVDTVLQLTGLVTVNGFTGAAAGAGSFLLA